MSKGFRLRYISVLAGVIGVSASIIAFLIYHLIGFLYNVFFYQRLSFEFVEPPTSGLPIWIILVPALGGLIAGLMAKYGSQRIVGHGIPEAMEAVWRNKSKVEPRVLFLKPISAAIAIGTGAPFGVEGPIIQSGGAMGSVIGQWISTTVAERKILLACGAAAGMAATFNTPLAAILVAIELLVFEFRARSFIPISIASVIATGMRHNLLGSGPMFFIEKLPVDFFANLPFLIILGIIIGGAAILFNKGYFSVEKFLHRVPVNDVVLPAIGGLILGIMGLLVPRTFGVGYSVAEEILNNQLTWGLVALVMLFKVGGVFVTLGTKTSGGFLAPVFVAGAAIGNVFAHGMNALLPGISLPVSLFALAGLGTLFGVVSNATFGFTLFAIEVTGHFDALLPVFIVAVVADIVTTLYMKSDIMTTELANRGIEIEQNYEVDVLKRFKAKEVMDKNPVTITSDVTIAQLVVIISDVEGVDVSNRRTKTSKALDLSDEERKTTHDGFPIVDAGGQLTGIITYGDIVKALARGKESASVEEMGTTDLATGYPDERLFDLVVRMSKHQIEQLPIVSRENSRKLVGLLDSQDLMTSSLRQLEDEQKREKGRLSYYINLLPSRRLKKP